MLTPDPFRGKLRSYLVDRIVTIIEHYRTKHCRVAAPSNTAFHQPYSATVYNVTQGGEMVGDPIEGTTTSHGSAPGLIDFFSRFNIIADPNRGIEMDHLNLAMSDEPFGAHDVLTPEPASVAMLLAGGLMALRRSRRG